MIVIADTSCLVVLRKIDRLILLHQLYATVTLTTTVADEYKHSLPVWVETVPAPQTGLYIELQQQLDPGEASAIALAKVLGDCLLIVDEAKGRRVAGSLGIPIIGTLGVLLRAKEAGLIDSLGTILAGIREHTDFRFSTEIETALLAKAGEL